MQEEAQAFSPEMEEEKKASEEGPGPEMMKEESKEITLNVTTPKKNKDFDGPTSGRKSTTKSKKSEDPFSPTTGVEAKNLKRKSTKKNFIEENRKSVRSSGSAR